MPYKTESGTHYHMTYGCCRATISCGTEGLKPCATCCGKGAGGGGPSPAGASGMAGGMAGSAGIAPAALGDGATALAPGSPEQAELMAGPTRAADAAGIASAISAGPDGLAASPAPSPEMGDQEMAKAAQRYGYRTEVIFGEGYTDAAEVMAHETFALENTDIMGTLADTILRGTEVGERLRRMAWMMDKEDPTAQPRYDQADKDAYQALARYGAIGPGEATPEGVAFFRDEVLPAIRQATGYDIRHVMWLCDSPEDVMDAYGGIDEICPEDIDEHPVGEVILSDIGMDGKLWGYVEEPIRPEVDPGFMWYG